jgi:TPR repeat protein
VIKWTLSFTVLDGIAMDESLAAHYYQLSADQGSARAQFHYAFLPDTGDGIVMDKSLAAHYDSILEEFGDLDAQ